MKGPIVKPGEYSATLYLVQNGLTTKLSEKKSFELKPIYKSTLKGTSFKDYDKYVDDYFEVYHEVELIEHKLKKKY